MENKQPLSPRWGINKDYAKLTDVLLGKPEHYRWVEAGPLIGRTLNNAHMTGATFNLQIAMAQHAEMVSIYEENDVSCLLYTSPSPRDS